MPGAVFLATLAVYWAIGPDAPQGGDTVPNRYLPLAVSCGDWTLDRFSALWESPRSARPDRFPYYATRAVTGSLVSTFGPAVPALSAPFYWVWASAFGLRDSPDVLRASRVLAGLLGAVAALFTYLACSAVAGLGGSLLAAAAFAFGSGVWSVASRGLWQHTWATPCVALGVWALLSRPLDRAGLRVPLAGLAFAIAFACRPQTGVFLVAAAVAVLLARRESFTGFLLAAAPVLLLVSAYNTWYFDSPFAFAQTVRSSDVALHKTGSASLIGARPWVAAAGLLLSPSRGLFVFSPVFAAGFVALVRPTRDPRVLRLLVLATLGLFLTAAFWFDWWGGATVWCRPLIEATPILAVGTAIGWDRYGRGFWMRLLIGCALIWSVALGAASVTHPGAVAWNEEVQVDRHPERLWNLSNSLPVRLLELRPQDRIPLADSRAVRVVECGVQDEFQADFSPGTTAIRD